MARRLIINADDFGHTRGINQGIVEAHQRGVVTSTTLMVQRPFAAQAAALAKQTPTLSIGLHITLTGAPPGARPALPARQVSTLVDDRGYLPRTPDGLKNADAKQVEREIQAQLAHFEKLMGRAPSHLDSHHHSHRQPPVLEAIVQVAKERSLPVRNASSEVQEELTRWGIPTTDRFIEDFYDETVGVDDLLEQLAGLEEGTTELMCHPGHADEILLSGSTYTWQREKELHTLCSPRVLDAVRRHGIELASFRDLVAEMPTGAV